MKLFARFFVAVLIIFLASCTSANLQPITNQTVQAQPQAVKLAENFKIAVGQTIYVPVYSHIYYEDKQKILVLQYLLC